MLSLFVVLGGVAKPVWVVLVWHAGVLEVKSDGRLLAIHLRITFLLEDS
jgi:hypothetical protein